MTLPNAVTNTFRADNCIAMSSIATTYNNNCTIACFNFLLSFLSTVSSFIEIRSAFLVLAELVTHNSVFKVWVDLYQGLSMH